jgi:oxygen-independent coproporphyrinogen-3 oxidase
MEKIRDRGRAVVGEEEADLRTAAGEFMFLGLRLKQGVLVERFAHLFGNDPIELYPQLRLFKEEGLVEAANGCLRLTRRGFTVANSIFVNFV